ncbi:MAG: hypothetical protein KC587_18450 [Nitrospira sp.]|nr:hypothetical protein [Nitrospira sp.]
MGDYPELQRWNYEDLVPGGTGREPPEHDLPSPMDEDGDHPNSKNEPFNYWLMFPMLAVFALIAGAIASHYLMYQPVVPMGKDAYLSDMGFVGWLFEGPQLEAVTAADFFASVFSLGSVILADIFFNFMLIAGFLDRPEEFLSRPSMKAKSYLIIFFYLVTIGMEILALYWRMQLNTQVLNDPGNPFNDLQIHGMGELFGYSVAIICLNAACAFLATQLIHYIKKEMQS